MIKILLFTINSLLNSLRNCEINSESNENLNSKILMIEYWNFFEDNFLFNVLNVVFLLCQKFSTPVWTVLFDTFYIFTRQIPSRNFWMKFIRKKLLLFDGAFEIENSFENSKSSINQFSRSLLISYFLKTVSYIALS